MNLIGITARLGRLVGILGLVALLAPTPPAVAQPTPDFDGAPWLVLSCPAGDPAGDEHPASVDLVGDATYPAAFVARDASFLYLRYRVNGDPSGSGGFGNYAWNALMQVPSGNPFQYQYELSLFGVTETIEIWANTTASNIQFSPLFADSAETKIFSQSQASAGPYNAGPLARHLATGDGSAFGGSPDYFVDVAFPVPVLIAQGVVTSAAELDEALFFPATATNANNYNKGSLGCTFGRATSLSLDKTVAPQTVPAGSTTPITYTIDVANAGLQTARGVVIKDALFPAYLANRVVTVSSANPAVAWTVASSTPLEVRVPALPSGATVRVQIAADATPGCNDNSFTNVATAFATNAPQVSDDALLAVNPVPGGCAPCATNTDCDDANACTTDTCTSGACASASIPGCTSCGVAADCPDDANPCTEETCTAGVCGATPVPGCTTCAVDAECGDGDACTADACSDGTCTATPLPGCGACATEADCDDLDECTTDACTAGLCAHAAIADCPMVEQCTGGVDEDGDGAVDCDDSDCAGDPACPPPPGTAEVCGDCIDNDGDGLVDYEDPDCCAATTTLEVKRLMLKATAKKAKGRRLKVKVARTNFPIAFFDPMSGDTTLQISDPAGTIFCQTMPAGHWTHPRKRSFRFRDKTGAVAGGLKRSRFKMKRNGAIAFRALARKVALRPTEGHDVKVTLGVGGQCSQSMTQLRAKRRAMVLP